jgi:hypothetical protein
MRFIPLYVEVLRFQLLLVVVIPSRTVVTAGRLLVNVANVACDSFGVGNRLVAESYLSPRAVIMIPTNTIRSPANVQLIYSGY